MQLKEYLKTNNITMAAFGEKIKRAQSIVSRLCNGRHRADPTTAVRITIVTKGAVTLDDQYGTPSRWRADRER